MLFKKKNTVITGQNFTNALILKSCSGGRPGVTGHYPELLLLISPKGGEIPFSGKMIVYLNPAVG